MGAVALERDTWAALEAAGACVEVSVVGLTAPRVSVAAPPAVAARLRGAIAWRQDAMRAQLRRPGTLVAVEGPHPRGCCGSCGEAFVGGDCPLCNAARIGVLRAAGVLPPATATGREPSDYDAADAAWRDTLRLTPTGKPFPRTEPVARPLDRTSPFWWACPKGHDNWGPRSHGCGPCEAAHFGDCYLSALGGGR